MKHASIMKSCPKCKSNMIIDIIYDEIAQPDSHESKCKSCGYAFGGLNKFLNDEFLNDDL